MTDDLKAILADHALWLRGEGGRCADLSGADLSGADLASANLMGANVADACLAGAYLGYANLAYTHLKSANLRGADLVRANLVGANLVGTNLADAHLAYANLSRANLRDANLGSADLTSVTGNMREIRSMQISKWPVVYTADTLQIGCQRHLIAKWREWTTYAGRKWVEDMNSNALAWADRNLALVLQIIDANPATPTGNEASARQKGNDNE